MKNIEFSKEYEYIQFRDEYEYKCIPLLNLKAGSSVMKKSTTCSYLGDILCSTGSVDAMIESRRQKGIGICSQVR